MVEVENEEVGPVAQGKWSSDGGFFQPELKLGSALRIQGDKEGSMLDVFYLVLGIGGFALLWAIAKACDRI
jgi:hypothetical protein